MLENRKPGEPRVNICSLCSKHQNQIERLVAGPGNVSICNECVDLCREIIEEEWAAGHPAEAVGIETNPSLVCGSCGTLCPGTDHYCFNCGQKLPLETGR